MQIGVTGHRDIAPPHRKALAELAAQDLAEIVRRAPDRPVTLLSSLAAGADQICAQTALALGYGLIVPLPMDPDAYAQDFEEQQLQEFHRLYRSASHTFVVRPSEQVPREPGRGFLYRQAGRWIARGADVLLALWDGDRTLHPEGGGTYETIRFALELGKPVRWIFTPRGRREGSGTPHSRGWYCEP